MPTHDLTQISARDWLEVRDRVALSVGKANPRMEQPTRVKIAEQLLGDEYIDVQAVVAAIRPAVEPEHATDNEDEGTD